MSAVWKYFKVDGGNPNKAVCSLCDVNNTSRLIQRGNKPKHYSTKPLWNHLKNSHKTTHDKIVVSKPKVNDEGEEDEIEGDVDDPQAGTSTSTAQSSSQPTLQQFISRKKLWDVNSAQSKNLTRVIGEMIALDAEPYLIVERDGFKKLMKTVAPQYTIPSRKTFSDKVVPEIYTDVRIAVEGRFEK